MFEVSGYDPVRIGKGILSCLKGQIVFLLILLILVFIPLKGGFSNGHFSLDHAP